MIAVAIGLRGAAFLAPLGALVAAATLLASPVRSLKRTDAESDAA